MSRDVRKLEVFVTADALLLEIVAEILQPPISKAFAFRDQLQRAALSVPLNLVEGSQRTTTREYARFVEIAAGSAAEAAYLLSVMRRTYDRENLARLERNYDTLVARLQRLRLRLSQMAEDAAPAGVATPHRRGPRTKDPEPPA